MSALLQIAGLTAHYGDFQALFGVDLTLDEGQTVAIIGANGAGKTTLMRAITGVAKVTAGSVTYDGRNLLDMDTFSKSDPGGWQRWHLWVPARRSVARLCPSLHSGHPLRAGHGEQRVEGGERRTSPRSSPSPAPPLPANPRLG